MLGKLETYDESGLPCIRFVSKQKFVHDTMNEESAQAIASRCAGAKSAETFCGHEILGEGLLRGGSPAQLRSIVRRRKIEYRALGDDPGRIYCAMALVIVSLSVIEIDSRV
jgi:hypothetical protein